MSRRTPIRFAAVVVTVFAAFGASILTAQAPTFEVTVDPATRSTPLTGRLIVVVSRTAQPEPRMIMAPQGPAMFAIDLDQLRPGQPATLHTKTTLGYLVPRAS